MRREFSSIITSYASINYTEYVSLDLQSEAVVGYDELISHIKASRPVYFHSGLGKEFHVGYLLGLFERKESTIQKFNDGEYTIETSVFERQSQSKVPPVVVQILNNNSPVVNTHVNINIKVDMIREIGSSIQGDANYLLEEIGKSNHILSSALARVIEFSQDSKNIKSEAELKEKGWGRKLKGIVEALSTSGDNLKKINDGGEAMGNIVKGIKHIASQTNMHDIAEIYEKMHNTLQALLQ